MRDSKPGSDEVDELATPDERENEAGHRPEHEARHHFIPQHGNPSRPSDDIPRSTVSPTVVIYAGAPEDKAGSPRPL